MSLREQFRRLQAEADLKVVGPATAHVEHGPLLMYLRIGRRFINGQYIKTIQIATVSINDTKLHKQGIFTEALAILMEESPLPVFIECVHHKEFGDAMIRRGFEVHRSAMDDMERDLFLSR